MTTTPIHTIATGRVRSLFADDIKRAAPDLREAIASRRVLVIGGAGSIGSNTVFELARCRPAALHIVDQHENGLAELVRQLRSRPLEWHADDFQTLPLDYGSSSMRLFLASQPAYDFVLNFAALKHVRTEKDPFSTLQMFETNLYKQSLLMEWLAETGFKGRFFTVSTDKAANPSSMMGASKRSMEHVLFNSSRAGDLGGIRSSARFANVAFSNGSLLQGFENRLARGEPIAAPRDTKRYFVSLSESGELCAIAGVLGPENGIVIPRLEPKSHLVYLHDVATRFLQHHGYEAAFYEDEAEACSSVSRERERGHWPLLLTALDTAGEKPYEEFSTSSEKIFEFGYDGLRAVQYLAAPREAIDAMLAEVHQIIQSVGAVTLTKEQLKQIIAMVEPAFLHTHRDSSSNLDQRL